MKTKSLLLFCLLQLNISYSQTLSIDETVNYINNLYSESKNGLYILNLLPTGELTLYQDYSKWTYNMNIDEIKVGEIYTGNYGPMFDLKCKKYGEHCIMLNSHDSQYSLSIQNRDLYLLKKLNNAYKYLFAKIEEDGTYKRYDNDPFAPNNFNLKSIEIKEIGVNNDVILEKLNGVYYLDLSIGKITKKFILDTGASEVFISEEFEKELISSGILKKNNYQTPGLYQIADGSIIECRRIIIPELKIGNFIVKNVSASVGKGQTPLLLGKSLLDKFKSWKIDNLRETLKLEK